MAVEPVNEQPLQWNLQVRSLLLLALWILFAATAQPAAFPGAAVAQASQAEPASAPAPHKEGARPGEQAQAEPWERSAVPHGVVRQQEFTTHIVVGLPANRDAFYVYTPPGYDPHGSTRYPVLYLLHGWGDSAGSWNQRGHSSDIFDNLIAAGQARPMIVVMPLGYGDMSFLHDGFDVWRNRSAVDHNVLLFSQSLLTEVIPLVEASYRVSTAPEDRAIAGLSMGGLEALTTGLLHPDEFRWVGGFSSAVHLVDPVTLPHVSASAAPRLLWISCGTSDQLLQANRALVAALTAAGLKVTPIETPGAHVWSVWRDNLLHFAPLLFQN